MKSRYYQCPYCEHLFRKDDDLYEYFDLLPVLGSHQPCPSCGKRVDLSQIYAGSYDVPAEDVLSGKYGSDKRLALLAAHRAGEITLTSEELKLIPASTWYELDKMSQKGGRRSVGPRPRIGKCAITGETTVVYEVPDQIYRVEKQADDLHQLEALRAASPEYIHINENLLKALRPAMLRRGLLPFILLLFLLGVLLGNILFMEGFFADNDSDLVTLLALGVVCVWILAMPIAFLQSMAYIVAPYLNGKEYMLKSAFLAAFLTRRSDKHNFYYGKAYSQRIGQLRRRTRNAPVSSSAQAKAATQPSSPPDEPRYDVEALIKALRHRDKSLRVKAAAVLGKVGDPRALEPLRVASQSKDEKLSKAATAAIQRIEKPPVA